jgi:signal transduction histidine kinase/CheY-like chemotaxis protein/PAS domain-containing protein
MMHGGMQRMEKKGRTEAEIEFEALDEIPSGVGVFDVTDAAITMKYLNDGFYRMIGAHREDRARFFNEGTINSVYPDDRKEILAEALRSIREHRVFDCRFRNLDGRGKYIWIGIRASHKPVDEKTERFYASYYDVDQYVSERDELTAYGKRLDSILGSIPGGVAVFYEMNSEIRLAYSNAGFYSLHHGSREYWSKQSPNPVEWLAPEDRHLFWDEFRKASSGEKEQGNVVYRVIGEDGKLHWVANQFCRAGRVDGMQYYYASFTDMDDQITAEQEMQQNKLMYDDAAKSSKMIIWSYDPVSKSAKMMQSGYTEEICRKLHVPPVIENVAETILPYVYPEDREAFRSSYRAMDEGAERAECEFRFQMPGQETQQRERMVMKRVTDKDGRLLNVFCFGQNITEQKQKEFDYEQTLRRLDQAYPHALGSFRLNLTHNWCEEGKSSIPFLLQQQEKGTADGYFKEFSKLITDEETKADFQKRFDRKLLLKEFAEGTSKVSIEYPVIYPDGRRYWRDGMLFMLKNPKTGDVEAITYALDIDKRKKNEFIMERIIHDHFDYIGIIHPKAGTFEFFSRRPWIDYGKIGEILPYDECRKYVHDQFRREDERRYFDETASLDAIIEDMNANGRRTATYLRTAEEKTECIRLQYCWLEKAGGDILVVRSDITESYQKEQNQISLLAKEKHAAEAANIAKTEFLSRMSHDMRTPLNGVIGMAYLAQKQENSPTTADCLKKINTSAKFLLSLINNILDMAKVENGDIDLHYEPAPIDEYKEYLDAVIKPLCRERNQQFILQENVDTQNIPLADKSRIDQVLFNLLSNAVKFTPEGGTITYSISSRPVSPNRMEISHRISDTGIGISKEFQERMYEPFAQEGRDDTSERRGSGLGLPIVKKLTDLMGGTISVESEPGQGTTFVVKFTFDTVPVSSIPAGNEPDKTEDEDSSDLTGMHVLLCEDHPLNQEIARALLNEKGVIVRIAEDGQKGVDDFSGSAINYYDCILMDLRMPVLNGIEAAKAIRAAERPDAKTIPIYAMTADAFTDDVKKCLDAGMNGHIAKPIDPGKLYAVLKHVFR